MAAISCVDGILYSPCLYFPASPSPCLWSRVYLFLSISLLFVPFSPLFLFPSLSLFPFLWSYGCVHFRGPSLAHIGHCGSLHHVAEGCKFKGTGRVYYRFFPHQFEKERRGIEMRVVYFLDIFCYRCDMAGWPPITVFIRAAQLYSPSGPWTWRANISIIVSASAWM